MRYNDRSVLENYHVAHGFAAMKNKDFNILENFGKEDYKKMRESIITAVLATDMAKHYENLTKFNMQADKSTAPPLA